MYIYVYIYSFSNSPDLQPHWRLLSLRLSYMGVGLGPFQYGCMAKSVPLIMAFSLYAENNEIRNGPGGLPYISSEGPRQALNGNQPARCPTILWGGMGLQAWLLGSVGAGIWTLLIGTGPQTRPPPRSPEANIQNLPPCCLPQFSRPLGNHLTPPQTSIDLCN